MNFFYFIGLIFVINFLRFSTAEMVNGPIYIENLCRNLIEKLQTTEISGNGLPMLDFSTEINVTKFELTVVGIVSFKSGFINKIRSSHLGPHGVTFRVFGDLAQIEANLFLNGVEIFYDMDVDVVGFQGKANVLMEFPQFVFSIDIRKTLSTNRIIYSIKFMSATQKDMRIKHYPNNKIIQMISQQLYSRLEFRQPLLQSFTEWTSIFQQHFVSAADELEFPIICYYCPTYKTKNYSY